MDVDDPVELDLYYWTVRNVWAPPIEEMLFPPPVEATTPEFWSFPVPGQEEWVAPISQEQVWVPLSPQAVMETPVENPSKLFQTSSAKFVESSVPEEKPSAPRYIRSYFEPGFVATLPQSMMLHFEPIVYSF